MADNIMLARIQAGIAALTNEQEIRMVLAAAREHKQGLTEKRERKKRETPVRRGLTMEDKIALTQGNSEEMISKNEEMFDFRLVLAKDLTTAKKWFNAPKPSASYETTELSSAYHQWMIWNSPKYRGYKGNAIMEKATGLSPVAPDEEVGEDEDEAGVDDDEAGEDENEKMMKDLAALRLAVKEQGWNVD